MREVLKLAVKMGIALDVDGHGLVLHQSPGPDTPLTRGSVVKVLLARALPAKSAKPAESGAQYAGERRGMRLDAMLAGVSIGKVPPLRVAGMQYDSRKIRAGRRFLSFSRRAR